MLKTTKVRIPVASFTDGVVVSGQCNTGLTDDEKLKLLEAECKECGYDTWELVNWIVAEVPIPEPTEIEGEVE
jgi:surface antigen